MGVLIVYSTFPNEASARDAANVLVENRLAACVSILPSVKSVYRWQGKTAESSEVLLMIKTTQETYPQLETALKDCHPYELPEILAVRAEAGLPGYLKWVAEETTCNNK